MVLLLVKTLVSSAVAIIDFKQSKSGGLRFNRGVNWGERVTVQLLTRPIVTARGQVIRAGRLHQANAPRVRAVREEDATSTVSGRDGAGGAVDPVVPVDRASISKRRQRAALGGLERMLRVYFLQQWFNLSDPGLEEALHDSVVSWPFAQCVIWNSFTGRRMLRNLMPPMGQRFWEES